MITFARIYKPSAILTLSGQVITSIAIPGVATLRVQFQIQRTMTPSPDTATATVWGLDPIRATAMRALFAELGRDKLTIASGYDGITSHIFAGDVRSIRRVQSGGDVGLVVTADDAGDALADATISLSTAGLTAQNLIDYALLALAAAGAPVVAHPSVAAAVGLATPSSTVSLFSSVHVGKVSDLLTEAARVLGCRWWIRDNQLFMAARGLPTDGMGVFLPRTHWLSEPADDGSGLVRMSTFLDPNIVPGRQVSIQGRLSPLGIEPMRVESAAYTADSEGSSPWSVEVACRRILA